MIKKLLLFLSAVFLFSTQSVATHNRAGEITYVHISGLTYQIIVTTYTDPASVGADRCELEIKIKSSSSTYVDTIPRINDGFFCMNCPHCGEQIAADVKKNIYILEYTFPGPDSYVISVEDPNRVAGVNNIPNSVNVPFYIESTMMIDPFGGYNSSPVLLNSPIQDGCVNKPYQYSPLAVDTIDGDSLAYELAYCKGINGQVIQGYNFPNETPGCPSGTITIDPVTGELYWDSPQCVGLYNLCILVKEYRNGVLIGTVLRDMQITIYDCNNNPPEIEPLPELCILAGDTLDYTFQATDPDTQQVITISSYGDMFNYPNPPLFDSIVDNPATGHVYWETSCNDVKKDAHVMYFKAEDNDFFYSLSDFKALAVKVVAPAPDTIYAQPQGNFIYVNWSKSLCTNASCYKIYRKTDSLGYVPDSCITGVPAYTGYQLVGQTNSWNDTSFVDTDPSLVHGQKYCYMVVACFDDGAESYPTFEVCTNLKKDVPVITHVSVITTDSIAGLDSIIWSKPTEIDTTQYSGNYYYQIYRDGNPIGQTSANNLLSLTDTFYVDTLNTQDLQHSYYIQLYNDNTHLGETHTASSIFLSATPSDKQVILSWTENVPWTNKAYIIYRKTTTNTYQIIDTVTQSTYTDFPLTNGKTYCYYIRSKGEYSQSGFIRPIYNNSQEVCAIPVDNTAPCEPQETTVIYDCETLDATLQWTSPPDSCGYDAEKYYIYYAPTIGIEYQLIDSTENTSVLDYLIQTDAANIAGCYAIASVDTFKNISRYSQAVCIDNCPEYELPNVFTPGNDGINDVFRPFPYRFIEKIHIKIYNRWGTLVYETENPDILWNGNNQSNGKPCPDGVYFYMCDVYEKRITGTEMHTLKGFIHLIRNDQSIPPR